MRRASLPATFAAVLALGGPAFGQIGVYPTAPTGPYPPNAYPTPSPYSTTTYRPALPYGVNPNALGPMAAYPPGYGGQGVPYAGQGPGYANPGAGYVNPNAGYANPGAGYLNPGAGYVNPGAGYAGQGPAGYAGPYNNNPVYPTSYNVPTAAPGQITALADQLVGQADSFLQAMLPKVGIVPESQYFLAEGQALRDSAVRLRSLAASGAAPAALSREFVNVAGNYQRLEARMARVNRGRVGHNIANALQMSTTIQQIQQLLP